MGYILLVLCWSHFAKIVIGTMMTSMHRSSFPITGPLIGAWWRHQMETFSALPAICAGNSPVSGEFPAQRPVAQSFDVFFDLGLNKRLSKQSCGWWFETLLRQLWRHCNGINRWQWIPLIQGEWYRALDGFVVSLIKLLNKPSGSQWFEAP